MSEEYNDDESNCDDLREEIFSNKDIARKYVLNLIDGFFEEAQSPNLLLTARAFGAIEGAVVAGMGCGALTATDMDQIWERMDVIRKLKSESVLEVNPFIFVPPTGKGKRWIKNVSELLHEDHASFSKRLMETGVKSLF
jgi:hypothetical protein